ncbi:hypothetical protein [Chachezhania antarctica]|uniref:hypothetical protein n=1 Tax=Chachezhania antarctica TaxID=2340860 RepID=UPI000EB41F97|nr:hypothetical protein [Chachezhania antarctica]|tara:strand:+ start:3980 stop:4195 length:216 start_codon:yes stop_codon:yes gene_type:complete
MMNPRHFVKMSRLAKHPPSTRKMIVMAVMIGLAALVAGIEKLGYWPDWATAERHRSVPVQKAPAETTGNGD